MYILVLLKFTPLEFETQLCAGGKNARRWLKFTPLEFETKTHTDTAYDPEYGLKFTPLEFETSAHCEAVDAQTGVKIYSVGV